MDLTRHLLVLSPVGPLTVVADSVSVVGLYWPTQQHRRHFADPGEEVPAGVHPILDEAETQLQGYFAGDRTEFTVPMQPSGDEFSIRVWNILKDIPYGQTATYGAIAKQLGNTALAQRVGQAVGANPIGLMIPCHRVLGADGSLTGFSGGLDVKRWLLTHEQSHSPSPDRLF